MYQLATLIDRHGVTVDEHLDRDDIVPVLTGLQFQGDVAVIPTQPTIITGPPVPKAGIPVVRGENGGHTHLLLGEGHVFWDAGGSDLALGVLTVADGATAWLAHPEHGYAGIGTGTYEIRRQREQAESVRMVAD